ncbi:MAG: TIR domain-containing protein [Verrucomicrobiota bacterium]
MRQIFISYAHQDAEIAQKIAEYLKGQGFTCWLDQAKLRVGQLYDERIANGIAQSAAVLVLVSRSSVASEYVKYEATTAINRKIPIAPVFLETIAKLELKAPLDFTEMRVHALNFASGKQEENLPRLARELKDLVDSRQRRRIISIATAALAILFVLGAACWIVILQGQKRATEEKLKRALNAAPPVLQMLADAHAIPPAPVTPTASSTSTSGEAELNFQVNSIPTNGTEWTPLSDGDALASGEEYFIRAEPLTAGYLYIFQQDSSGKLEWIYPANNTSTNSSGTNPVPANVAVTLPAERDLVYTLDNHTGIEHFYAVLSHSRWNALEEALTRSATSAVALPLADEVSGLLAVRAKGIAGVVRTGAPRQTEARATKGRSLPAVIQPVAHRSTSHWLFVHRAVRHIAASRSP